MVHGDIVYKVIRDHILRIVVEILTDSNEEELTDLNSKNFILIAKYLSDEDRGTYILPVLIGLAHDIDEEAGVDHRCLATKLFSQLACFLGKDYCEQYIASELILLADDKSFLVRKLVALSLINVSYQINRTVYTYKIIPVYKL